MLCMTYDDHLHSLKLQFYLLNNTTMQYFLWCHKDRHLNLSNEQLQKTPPQQNIWKIVIQLKQCVAHVSMNNVQHNSDTYKTGLKTHHTSATHYQRPTSGWQKKRSTQKYKLHFVPTIRFERCILLNNYLVCFDPNITDAPRSKGGAGGRAHPRLAYF